MSLQDTTKIGLGGTRGTFKRVENFKGSKAAGLAVVQKSDGTITTTLTDGQLLGVSLGNDESNTGVIMPVCREGSGVPIQLGSAFTPTIGAQVQIHATSGQAVASGTAVNASFTTGILTGEQEDGTTLNVALIDMIGGL